MDQFWGLQRASWRVDAFQIVKSPLARSFFFLLAIVPRDLIYLQEQKDSPGSRWASEWDEKKKQLQTANESDMAEAQANSTRSREARKKNSS